MKLVYFSMLFKSDPLLLELPRSIAESSMKCTFRVFKNGPSTICGRQPVKNMKAYGLSKFLKAVFHKLYLVHSRILVIFSSEIPPPHPLPKNFFCAFLWNYIKN